MNTYRKPRIGAMTERVETYLDSVEGTFTYGQIARRLGSHPRAIGRCMKALERLGRNDLCGRVIKEKR